VSKHSKD